MVAIPTTAGTGSEVTLWAVITDHDRKIKFNVGGTPLIGAHVALIDPELMLGLPPAVTAATGMDALSHAIECYTCDYHQPFNDAVALQAIELVARWLRQAVEEGSDLEARTHMAHAATLGGMAYGTESAGAAHAMSQSAGGVHDCPHRALTACVLGPVMEYNAPADPQRHARIAQGLGVDTSGLSELDAALAGVRELYGSGRCGHPDDGRTRLSGTGSRCARHASTTNRQRVRSTWPRTRSLPQRVFGTR
jgi:choline dehydrogenase